MGSIARVLIFLCLALVSYGSHAPLRDTLAIGTSGILLVHRDSEDGIKLEYRSADLKYLYHEKIFPLSDRSFAIEQGDSDAVIIAEPKQGTVTRAGRTPPDHEYRKSPRGINSDEKDGVMMWLEGDDESLFAVSALLPGQQTYGIAEDAPLSVDNCVNATLAATMRIEADSLIVVPVMCGGDLHIVKISLPIPLPNDKGVLPIKATSILVETALPLTLATAIATVPETQAVLIARSNGRNVCQIDQILLDLNEEDSAKVLVAHDTVFDCSMEAPTYFIRGLAYHDSYIYISAFTPGAIQYYSNSIGRVKMAPGVPISTPDIEVLLNRRNSELIYPELFSPGRLHIKRQIRGAHHLYWLDLMDGRISRMTFKTGPTQGPPRIATEPIEGHSCPASVSLLPPNTTANQVVPSLYWTDYGQNAIWGWSMEMDVNWSQLEEKAKLIAKTAAQPTALLVEPIKRMLYWTEPERKVVVAYSLDRNEILMNMTYRLDPEVTPSRFNSIAYLASTDRIYVTDSYPTHKRILSWKAPNADVTHDQISATEETWVASGIADFIPKAIVGDPHLSILYVSDAREAVIYAFYLNAAAGFTSDKIVARTPIILPSAPPTNSSNSNLQPIPNGPVFAGIPDGPRYGNGTAAFADDLPPQNFPHEDADRRFLSSENVDGGVEHLEDVSDGIVVKLFYRAPDWRTEPIRQMWLNDGNLHWAEVKPSDKQLGLLDTAMKYKRVMRSNNPQFAIDYKSAYVFSKSTGKSFVGTAQFFDVNESYLPENIWEFSGYVLSGLAILFMAVLGFCFFCKSNQLYDELDGDTLLHRDLDAVPEVHDGHSALMTPTAG